MNKKAILEGLLFVVGNDGLSFEKAKEILELNNDELMELIVDLENDYSSSDHGIHIEVLGNALKLVTKKEHKEYYQKLLEDNDSDVLSQAGLETLAIIAYNEPVTRLQIDDIRGVNSSHMIRKLISKNLIKEIGKSDLPGRPILYGITNDFLDYFGLSSKEELPKLKGIEEDDKEIDLFSSKYQEK